MAERRSLEHLPDIPLDKIVACLSAQDLRAFHQVSKFCKEALEKRKVQNDRRLELVELTRNNKENIHNGSQSQDHQTSTPASVVAHRAVVRERFDAKKCEDSPVLMECTNLWNSTPKSFESPPVYSNFPTPRRFDFQDFEEAEMPSQFANVVPSPSVPVPVLSSTMADDSMYSSIECVRDRHEFSNSDGALSLSNYQFHRSTENYSESNQVLECPNPNCRLRFSSGCEENEHSDRPSHVISSENFESFSENDISVGNNGCINVTPNTSTSCSSERSRESSKRKSKDKFRDQQKKSLRRIAKGP